MSCFFFQENQKDLETSTEVLSEYLERDICAENLIDIKQKVQDKYRYCDNRRKVLLAHVHEGYDKEWWIYIENDVTAAASGGGAAALAASTSRAN